MNFTISDKHIGQREEFRLFAREVIAPQAPETDHTHCFPRETIRKMAARGYLGLPIPVEWGGQGEDFITYIMLIEEVSRVCASTGVILAVHTSVGSFPILYYGSDEQKEQYLRRLATGEWLGAFALTESVAGSDAAALQASARKEGDYYILNGSKVFITNGGEADVYTVFATLDPAERHRGITAFLLKKDIPGLVMGRNEKKMGLHGSATLEIILDNVRVPVHCRLGKEGEGFKIALSLLDGGRIGIAAQGLGIAAASIEAAVDYARQRQQFGRPIAEFQAVAFALADMGTRFEAARLMVYRAAWLKENGLPCTREASMAKVMATDLAVEASSKAISILGARGGTTDYPVERYFRDAKVTQIYEGANQIQRIVIAREILK